MRPRNSGWQRWNPISQDCEHGTGDEILVKITEFIVRSGVGLLVTYSTHVIVRSQMKALLRRSVFLMSAVFLLIQCPELTFANTTYTYIGNPFTGFHNGTFSGSFDSSDFVTVILTFSSPLGPNAEFGRPLVGTDRPLAFSFSNGRC